ncbi:MAG: STT3 domain-containing protein, partial [Candidatus Omnitrophota bacterium]
AAIFLYICRLLNIPKLQCLVGGIFMALSPIFLQRSSYGWYDTDPYNVMFPLAILALLYHVLKSERAMPAVAGLAATSALYSLFWQGWIFMPVMVIASFTAVYVYRMFAKEAGETLLKKTLLYICLTVVFSCIFITPRGLIDSIREVSDIFAGFLFLKTSLWPDIFITVGELKTPSFIKMIHILGGYIFVFVSLAGIAMLIRHGKYRDRRDYAIVICLFYVFSLMMARGAERFMLFLLPPIAICFTAGLEAVSALVDKAAIMAAGRTKYAPMAGNSAVCLFLISAFIYAHAISMKQASIFNDVWYKALTEIRDKTPKDSIITTWWPPGHFIKAIADRRVTFDGATLNAPQAYWVADFFLTDNEKEAVGILRMLDSSGNGAVEFLLENGFKLHEAVRLLKEVVVLDKNTAYNMVKKYMSPEKSEAFIRLTHGSECPAYSLVYNDLVDNVLGLYYAKDWDFRKAMEFGSKRIKELKKGGFFWRGTKDNIQYMWSISGGSTYIGQRAYQTGLKDGIVHFGNGVVYNKALKEAYMDNLENRISGIPASILYLEDGRLVEKELADSNIKLSVLVMDGERISSCVVAPSAILRSVLFRLFYLDGLGLTHFRRVIHEENPSLNTIIIVYEVDYSDNPA